MLNILSVQFNPVTVEKPGTQHETSDATDVT